MTIDERLSPVLAVAAEHAADVDERGRFPEEAVAALRTSGLFGLTLPQDVGGLGADPLTFSLVARQLAGACGSTAMIYLMHVASAMPIASGGHTDVMGGMARGEALGTLAFSEQGSRSHFWAPVSQAKQAPDGIEVHAAKSWVTSAGHADVYVVSTGTPQAAAPTDSDLFIIEGTDPGARITGGFTGLGLRGNASSPMSFDGLLPTSARIGAEGSGFGTMMEVVLPWFNLGNASVSLGLARAALDAAIGHVSGAKLEHLKSSLADLPTIRARVAQAAIALTANEEYLNAAARKILEPADDTMLYVLGAKASANETALRVTDDAMRVCGGAAFSKHLPIERAFRDARAGHVMAPTADVLYDFYGKAICGMELF